MTKALTTQRFNMTCAWAGALVELALELRQKNFPPSPAEHPFALEVALTAIIAILICLQIAKQQRWTVTALCFVLGALFTNVTVFLVAWSSSLW